MRLLRGRVFEKAGVNVSHVWGGVSEAGLAQLPGAQASAGEFIACGISLVAHPANPYVPTVHMNLRYLATSIDWIGGGADLTPTFPFDEDTAEFHAALRAACDRHRAGRVQRVPRMVRSVFLPAAPERAARRRRCLLRQPRRRRLDA